MSAFGFRNIDSSPVSPLIASLHFIYRSVSIPIKDTEVASRQDGGDV